MGKLYASRSLSSRTFYSSVSSALFSAPASKMAVTNAYHQSNHGKINNELSLKECRLRGLFPDQPQLFNIHFFSAGISQAKNSKLLIVVYFTRQRCSLSFHVTTFALFLSYENRTNCIFHRILITNTSFVIKFNSFPGLTDSLLHEQCETSGGY